MQTMIVIKEILNNVDWNRLYAPVDSRTCLDMFNMIITCVVAISGLFKIRRMIINTKSDATDRKQSLLFNWYAIQLGMLIIMHVLVTFFNKYQTRQCEESWLSTFLKNYYSNLKSSDPDIGIR